MAEYNPNINATMLGDQSRLDETVDNDMIFEGKDKLDFQK